MQGSDPHADRWLAQLRDGNPSQKAEARRQLAGIFAARGLPNEAIGLLVANAQAGFGSAEQFQMLSRLYHGIGNEYLAASAAMEAARLSSGGTSPPSSSPSPPKPGPPVPRPPGQPATWAPSHPPPPSSPPHAPTPRARTVAEYRRAAHVAAQGGHTPSPGSVPGVPGGPGPSVLGVRLTRPVRIACWGIVAAIVVGAAALSVSSPVSSLFFVVAAGALALAVTGPSSARTSLRVPAGPLGDGSLLLVGLLAFLIGGALVPRGSSVPANPVAVPAATPGTLYAGTPTPAPTSAAGGAPSASAGAASAANPSPAPGVATTPSDTTGQRFVIVSDPSGVSLRVSPNSTRGGVAAGDGTLVVAVAADREAAGRIWRQVQAPDNERGWIEVERLKPAPTGPPPSFSSGRPPSGRSCTGGDSIKGYISSAGELIYHRTGSEHYYRTFPVVCFRTEDEARAAGFQPGPRSTGAESDTETAAMTPAAPSGPDPPAPPTSAPRSTQTADIGTRVRVVNAGNEGVRLRPSPGAEEILKILADGTTLESLGEEREDGGRQWRRVREQDGLEGWVAADFLAAAPATPTVVAAAPTPAPTAVPAPSVPPTFVAAAMMPPTQPPVATKPQATAPATGVSKPQAAVPAIAVPKPAPPAPTARPQAAQAAPKTAPRGMDCPASHPIKGNHSSSGEWIYHPPGGQFYTRTRPEDCFATPADASRAGYRPSQR